MPHLILSPFLKRIQRDLDAFPLETVLVLEDFVDLVKSSGPKDTTPQTRNGEHVLAWLKVKNKSIRYYTAKRSINYRAKTSIVPFDSKILCAQQSYKSKGKTNRKTGMQLRIFGSYKCSKSNKDAASEEASESEHMHLLNTPEVHQTVLYQCNAIDPTEIATDSLQENPETEELSVNISLDDMIDHGSVNRASKTNPKSKVLHVDIHIALLSFADLPGSYADSQKRGLASSPVYICGRRESSKRDSLSAARESRTSHGPPARFAGTRWLKPHQSLRDNKCPRRQMQTASAPSPVPLSQPLGLPSSQQSLSSAHCSLKAQKQLVLSPQRRLLQRLVNTAIKGCTYPPDFPKDTIKDDMPRAFLLPASIARQHAYKSSMGIKQVHTALMDHYKSPGQQRSSSLSELTAVTLMQIPCLQNTQHCSGKGLLEQQSQEENLAPFLHTVLLPHSPKCSRPASLGSDPTCRLKQYFNKWNKFFKAASAIWLGQSAGFCFGREVIPTTSLSPREPGIDVSSSHEPEEHSLQEHCQPSWHWFGRRSEERTVTDYRCETTDTAEFIGFSLANPCREK
ncbi:hypothetical protein EK904_005186 [Melospiza melodia maxima]|nr:hypothetical protein EK904_005186 [Melospiza melodia maxima]